MHGGVGKGELHNENVEAVKRGCSNLARHIANVKSFGVPVIVAVNRFVADTDAEVAAVRETAAENEVQIFDCTHWSDGGAGAEELAAHVAEVADSGASRFAPIYNDDVPLWEKIRTVATRIYGADGVIADNKVRAQIEEYQENGFGHFHICVAKTQYSFSTDPNLKGAPSGHVLPVREVKLSAGAGFMVVICGEIMTMPGLPRVPAANSIRINDAGEVDGLF